MRGEMARLARLIPTLPPDEAGAGSRGAVYQAIMCYGTVRSDCNNLAWIIEAFWDEEDDTEIEDVEDRLLACENDYGHLIPPDLQYPDVDEN